MEFAVIQNVIAKLIPIWSLSNILCINNRIATKKVGIIMITPHILYSKTQQRSLKSHNKT